MYVSELLLSKEEITGVEWQHLAAVLAKHIKGLHPFSIAVVFQENLVRYFIVSKKEISQLSLGVEGVILTNVGEQDQSLVQKPDKTNKLHLMRIPAGGNVLDLRERYKTQYGLELRLVYIDVQRLGEHYTSKLHTYFVSGNVVKEAQQQLMLLPVHLLQINFAAHTNYLRKTAPKYLSFEKTLHLLVAKNHNAMFSVDAFPYFSHDYYLNLTNYDFDKHSFIVGASGSGKSKLISLFVDRLSRTALKMNYRVVLIDPHASLVEDFEHVPDAKVISFGKQDSTDLFPGAGTDLTAATELTATLFKSILADQFNARLDRLLRFSLFVLMTAQTMSLENLKRFLTDVEYRNQIVEHVSGYVPLNVIKFFGADYNELRTQFYNQTILPLVSMVDEMQLQPSLVGGSEVSLAKTIQDNFLTVFSLNKVSMGEKVVKTVAGLLIQQIFLLAQARAFGQKVILIIDEVSVVQNPALAQILAEARKFNLTVILSQQYFGQVEKDLRDAIFANVYNYYAFKVSEEDARALEGNLNIELPKELVEAEHAKGIKESDVKVKMMTELHPRECLIRVLAGGQIVPCIKGRTVDAPAVTDHHKNTAPALKQLLPEKFIEGAAVPRQPIKFSQEFLEQLINHTDQGIAEAGQRPSVRVSSLRDLLAMHSSSRDKINKKDTQRQ